MILVYAIVCVVCVALALVLLDQERPPRIDRSKQPRVIDLTTYRRAKR